MGRIGPPDLVQVRVPLRIGLGRGYQPAPVVLVDRHLLGQQEPRAQPRGLSTRASTAATPRASPIPPAAITGTGVTASTTAGTNGSVATLPQTCPPAFPALRDDHVHAGRDCPPGLLGAADRGHDDSPGGVHRLDVAVRISPEKRDDPQAGVKGLVKATVVIFGENEVAAERRVVSAAVSRTTRSASSDQRQHHHAERAGIRDRRGQPGKSQPWAPGRSVVHPSISHTGVRTGLQRTLRDRCQPSQVTPRAYPASAATAVAARLIR